MRNRRSEHIFVILVVLATCFFLCSPALLHAVDLSDLASQKDKASKELYAQLEQYSKACESYQKTYDERMRAEEELKVINERIKTLRGDISVRATSMYRQGPFQMLDLLLSTTSFNEFANTWDILSMINEQQAARIEEMNNLKSQQDELIASCVENERKAQTLRDDIEAQTAELKRQIDAIDDSIASMKKAAQDREVAQAEANRRLAQSVLDNQSGGYYPLPSYLGDGAWDATISALLAKYGLSESWLPTIRNIIWRESTNNPNAVGGGGAYVGLCQFGSHWQAPRGWTGTGDWRFDPVASIERMVQYIADTGGLGNHWASTNY